MASANPLQINGEDDDEFDWEAAVREIDVACENANPSTSSFNPSRSENGAWNGANRSNSFVDNGKRPSGNCKQSTLDSFIGKAAGPVREEKKWIVEETTEGFGGSDYRAGVEIDPEAAKTWIYPVNVPLREYQLAITRTALFSNTLVALPTGLGKTLIAAVVMYNYFRWFPEGKIVFAAPSRPLVIQQIEACHNIMGIPQEWTIDMTGQICPTKRACFWKSKRVFFVTPQVLEKDIQAGTCLCKSLVCLVIDEAHRASGNYSYCVAVRELMAVPVELRILALSATPGSKQLAVQQIIDNLQISTLEYRDESDPDVSPYVHNRKVPMGKDAVDLNKLLLDVVRPYVSKLSALGLLPNRDFQTLSPPDFLNSRGEFRRAPPPSVPHNKGGEIEAYFSILITLYHIRKLLSSHGIRPVNEMLEEKLKQGNFARLMTRNEDIRRVKLIMEQSLTHGAPSPKLSKMLEVLVNHFKSKDSQNSRVIIFSNFRGSVRDIMNSLASIGDLVKPTEFIGQSSGKALKGQSQKVQQAVLQKFRAGGYNVIVATSIGEEGLDIMEVDLVICFDANVSPLRMIQRMGRTGRKHDGRVVVLACEGTELKSYTRKQASGRHIVKHMHNGGRNSFTFHSSPRMIPHMFKPEVQYVQMEIVQYIPRGKKVIDGSDIRTPVFSKQLTATESAVVAKYFQYTNWKPSLIAFPSVQTYPSPVHQVMHSSRTEMLIDAMQNLQALFFPPVDSRGLSVKGDAFSEKGVGIEDVDNEDRDKEDFGWGYDSPDNNSENYQSDCEETTEHELTTNSPSVLDCTGRSHPTHSFPLKVASHNGAASLNCEKESQHLKTSHELTTSSETRCKVNVSVNASQFPKTANAEQNMLKEDSLSDGDLETGINAHSPKVEYCDNYEDTELSPRLTNMLRSGVIPESPMNDEQELLNDAETEEIIVPRDVTTPMKPHTGLSPKSLSPWRTESNAPEIVVDADMACDRSQNPSPETTAAKVGKVVSSISPALKESDSPSMNISSSRDWLVSSSDKSDSVQPVRRLKRLRKVGELAEHKNSGSTRDDRSFLHETNLNVSVNGTTYRNQTKHGRGKREQLGVINDFIEEEAEVSPNGEASEDEIVDGDDNSYEPSFIDDRMNPTQPSRVDMMAVYRRSLLSQSPMPRESPSTAAAITPDSVNSGSSSANMLHPSLHNSVNQSTDHGRKSCDENHERKTSSSPAVPCSTSYLPTENSSKSDVRKRKFPSSSVPIINLEKQFSAEAANHGNAAADVDDIDEDMFYDDKFFATLDALEAQASSVLQQNNRSGSSTLQKPDIQPPPLSSSVLNDSELDGLPSFDLGF